MARNSKIEWTNHTWNPWVGCRKVSSGCKNCYMYRDQKRFGNDPTEIRRTSDKTFYAPKSWLLPARVFTCSWSDFFLEHADPWREGAWDVIRETPHLVYQILTKRPENIKKRLPDDWGAGWEHVWLGFSAEDQATFDERYEIMQRVDCSIRWLSAEPLLSEIDIGFYSLLDWVVAGGESGPNCRPMDIDWVSRLLQRCQENEIPFFFKQWGGRRRDPDGTWGGRIFAGRTWDQMPIRDFDAANTDNANTS